MSSSHDWRYPEGDRRRGWCSLGARQLTRTESCYSGKELFEAQRKMLLPNIPSVLGNKRGRSEEDNREQVATRTGLGYCGSGATCIWRPPSTCNCSVQEAPGLEEYESIRFCVPETWQLSIVQVSEGICPVCYKVRAIRQLPYRSEGILVGEEGRQGENWYISSPDVTRGEVSHTDQQGAARICPTAQEKDRGVPVLDTEKELQTSKDLDYFEPDDTFWAQLQDSEVAEQEPISTEAIRSEGLIHPWYDPAWEDELNNQIAGILPYIPNSDN